MMNRFKEIRKAERRNLSNVQYTAREPLSCGVGLEIPGRAR